jgi:hypothetical protein
MNRSRFLHMACAFAIGAGVCPAAPARAQEGPGEALLTLEGEADLRDRLWERVLLVTVRPTGGLLEDPLLVPERYGQAVRVVREGRAEVLTAALLVVEANEVRVAPTGTAKAGGGAAAREAPPGGGPIAGTAAKVAATDDATLLARLECGAPCDAMPAREAAPPEAWGPGRLVFYVVPATTDHPVLAHTASLGRQGEPFDAMIAVAGALPPGTVLFDPAGRVVAVAVRGSPTRTDRTLAAVMTIPKPEAEEDEAGGESPGKTAVPAPAKGTPGTERKATMPANAPRVEPARPAPGGRP